MTPFVEWEIDGKYYGLLDRHTGKNANYTIVMKVGDMDQQEDKRKWKTIQDVGFPECNVAVSALAELALKYMNMV